jgi:hypothetical protein
MPHIRPACELASYVGTAICYMVAAETAPTHMALNDGSFVATD